jgi:hypothetical protein
MQLWGLALAVVTIFAWSLLRWQNFRLGSLLERTLRQAADWIGHDLWVGVLLTLVGDYLIRADLGVDWVRIAALTVFAWLLVGLAFFLLSLVQTAFRRAWNKDWATTVYQHTDDKEYATFVLYNKHQQGVWLHGLACIVTDPNGVTSRNVRDRSGPVGEVLLLYPRDFENAPGLVPGGYRVIWQDREGGKWRELLADQLTVEMPVTKTTPWPRT